MNSSMNYMTRLILPSSNSKLSITKFDLPTNIYKTTFSTHLGHFEFLIIPFFLTNALASFQFLMNNFFHDYLYKFILIFIDILI